jgi:hypothetical protein
MLYRTARITVIDTQRRNFVDDVELAIFGVSPAPFPIQIYLAVWFSRSGNRGVRRSTAAVQAKRLLLAQPTSSAKSPLSRASRSFTGLILKVCKRSTIDVRLVAAHNRGEAGVHVQSESPSSAF